MIHRLAGNFQIKIILDVQKFITCLLIGRFNSNFQSNTTSSTSTRVKNFMQICRVFNRQVPPVGLVLNGLPVRKCRARGFRRCGRWWSTVRRLRCVTLSETFRPCKSTRWTRRTRCRICLSKKIKSSFNS